MTNNNQQLQDVITKAEQAVHRSNKVIANSKASLKELEQQLENIKLENQQAQQQIDAEINEIINEMDDATVNFIKDTQ